MPSALFDSLPSSTYSPGMPAPTGTPVLGPTMGGGSPTAFNTPGKTLQSPVSSGFGYGTSLLNQTSDEELKRRKANAGMTADQGVVSTALGYSIG